MARTYTTPEATGPEATSEEIYQIVLRAGDPDGNAQAEHFIGVTVAQKDSGGNWIKGTARTYSTPDDEEARRFFLAGWTTFGAIEGFKGLLKAAESRLEANGFLTVAATNSDPVDPINPDA